VKARREWLLVHARCPGFRRAAPTRAVLRRRPSSGGAKPTSYIQRRRDAVQQRRCRPGPSSPTLTRAVLRRRPWSGGAGPPSYTNRHSDAVQQRCRRPGTPSTSSVRTSKSIRPLLCHNLVFSAHFTFKFSSHLKSN